MVFTKRTERPTDDAPGAVSTEEEGVDLSAADADRAEARAVKAGTMVCGKCGATMAVPEP